MDRGCPHADRSVWFSCLHTQRKDLCYRYVTHFKALNNTATTPMKSSKIMTDCSISRSFSQVGGMPRQRTPIRWSVTIPKPISGPCAPPWKNVATGLVLLLWMERSTSWEEKKAGTGEGLIWENSQKIAFKSNIHLIPAGTFAGV